MKKVIAILSMISVSAFAADKYTSTVRTSVQVAFSCDNANDQVHQDLSVQCQKYGESLIKLSI